MGVGVGFGFENPWEGKGPENFQKEQDRMIMQALRGITGTRQRFTPSEIESITGGNERIRRLFGQVLSERDAAVADNVINRPDTFYRLPYIFPHDWRRDFGFN